MQPVWLQRKTAPHLVHLIQLPLTRNDELVDSWRTHLGNQIIIAFLKPERLQVYFFWTELWALKLHKEIVASWALKHSKVGSNMSESILGINILIMVKVCNRHTFTRAGCSCIPASASPTGQCSSAPPQPMTCLQLCHSPTTEVSGCLLEAVNCPEPSSPLQNDGIQDLRPGVFLSCLKR